MFNVFVRLLILAEGIISTWFMHGWGCVANQILLRFFHFAITSYTINPILYHSLPLPVCSFVRLPSRYMCSYQHYEALNIHDFVSNYVSEICCCCIKIKSKNNFCFCLKSFYWISFYRQSIDFHVDLAFWLICSWFDKSFAVSWKGGGQRQNAWALK